VCGVKMWIQKRLTGFSHQYQLHSEQ
jgi:hypothetical protein